MKSLLVSSLEEYSGKSALIIALGLILREKGLRIGYFKPFGVGITRIENQLVDENAYTTAKVLGTGDTIDDICPIKLDKPYLDFIRTADPLELKEKVIESYKRIAAAKDVVFVESAVEYKVGKALGLCDLAVSSMLDLDILMVAKYTNDYVLDKILAARELLGDRLRFIIFNQLSGYKEEYVHVINERFLKVKGIELLGTLPFSPLLAGLSIHELVDALHGEWLIKGKPGEEVIIEELLIGAMSPPSALKYFRRVRKAALITGGDRADLQNLALETGTIKCLLLTGNLEPTGTMLGKAEEKGVPVILVPDDTRTTLEKVDEVFGKARIRGEVKIRKMKELVKRFVDLKRLMGYLEG
ncbi:MAG: phosphotransacetylase family protein [Methanophagales archaeon ANME-1-THS]|nr:MAG: phosphotransacetylase family protein [Methanophagales archaeon ANME-1-THS]